MTTTSLQAIDRWAQLRRCLSDAAARLVTVLNSVSDPNGKAVGDWTIAETAVHLREVALVDAVLAAGVDVPPALRPVVNRAATVSIGEVAELNGLALKCEPERDPGALATLIAAQVDGLLDATATYDGKEPVRWLGGLTTTVAGACAHLLCELLVHGRDIATAEGRPFPIPAEAARLFFETFLFDVLQSPEMTNFGRDRAAQVRPVSWQLRLRGLAPVAFAFDGERLAVADESVRPDVRISADPAAMLLVMFGRVAPARAALTGRVLAWGCRPWRLGRLMRLVKLP